MSPDPLQRVMDAVQAHGLTPVRTGNGHDVICPVHSDSKPSLGIAMGDEGQVLFHCRAGCDTEIILRELGLEWPDLFPGSNGSPKTRRQIEYQKRVWDLVAEYIYTDRNGTPVFKVEKIRPPFGGDKVCIQSRFEGGVWRRGLTGKSTNGEDAKIQRVLYQLPELLAAERRYFLEGEADVESIRQWGSTATTNPGGVGNWRREFAPDLVDGATEIIQIGDLDAVGADLLRRVAADAYSADRTHREAEAKAAKEAEKIAASDDQKDAAKKQPSRPPLRIRRWWPPLPVGSGRDITDWKRAGGTRKEFRERVEREAFPVSWDGLPRLRANCIDLIELRPQAEQALVDLNLRSKDPTLYVYGEIVARMLKGERGCFTQPVKVDGMLDALGTAAHWYRITDKGSESSFPPHALAKVFTATPPTTLPPLLAITRSPVFASGWKLVNRPGYDFQSKLFYDPPGELKLPKIPDRPNREAVKLALGNLEDIFGEFPFATRADYSRLLAMLISPFIRNAASGCCPLFLIESPVFGTGKTLLLKAVSLIVEGRPPDLNTLPARSEEQEKQLTAALLKAPPLLCLDNVDTLGSTHLERLITSEFFGGRLLGKSSQLAIPNRSVVVATGNNVELPDAMPRRTIRIRLDAGTADPWKGRDFRYDDLPTTVLENRGALIASVLVLVRNWIAMGMPEGQPLASFESMVRALTGILEGAGITDFWDGMDDFYEAADSTAAEWEAFMLTWLEVSFNHADGPDRPWRTRELLGIAGKHGLLGSVLTAPTPAGRLSQIGIELGKMKDRVFDGRRLTITRNKSSKTNEYRLVAGNPPQI